MVRRRRIFEVALAALLAAGWLAGSAWSADEQAQPASVPPADETALDPDAVEVVKKMVKALADAKSLHVRVDEEYDALQSDGETLSFGKTSNMTLRRPDHLRVEGGDRTGRKHVSTFDGQRVTVYVAEDNAYATVEHKGDLDEIVDFLRDDVGMKLPLAGLFSPKLGDFLMENVTTATYVDEETLDGVDYDHVAFQYGEGIGIQLWVPVKGDAFPRRLVMTFEDARGRPQFRADFREWDRAPKTPDSLFAFTVPKGAKAVPFVLRNQNPEQQPPSPAGGGESR